MNLFFDRAMGKKIPAALRELRLPEKVLIHDDLFPHDVDDDVWLNRVGQRGWYVISQDRRFHANEAEWDALMRHQIGVCPRWWTFKLLVSRYDRIVEMMRSLPRPFLLRLHRNGRIVHVQIPDGVQIRMEL